MRLEVAQIRAGRYVLTSSSEAIGTPIASYEFE